MHDMGYKAKARASALCASCKALLDGPASGRSIGRWARNRNFSMSEYPQCLEWRCNISFPKSLPRNASTTLSFVRTHGVEPLFLGPVVRLALTSTESADRDHRNRLGVASYRYLFCITDIHPCPTTRAPRRSLISGNGPVIGPV